MYSINDNHMAQLSVDENIFYITPCTQKLLYICIGRNIFSSSFTSIYFRTPCINLIMGFVAQKPFELLTYKFMTFPRYKFNMLSQNFSSQFLEVCFSLHPVFLERRTPCFWFCSMFSGPPCMNLGTSWHSFQFIEACFTFHPVFLRGFPCFCFCSMFPGSPCMNLGTSWHSLGPSLL